MARKIVLVQLRVPIDLYDEILEAAEEREVSVNQFFLDAVEEYLEAETEEDEDEEE